MKQGVVGVLCLFVLGIGAHAVSSQIDQVVFLPRILDLATCKSLAARNNPALRLSRERIVEQDGVMLEISSSRRPHLTAASDYSVTDPGRLENFGSEGQDDTAWNADIEASIAVFTGGTFQPAYDSARWISSALQSSAVSVEQDVLLELHEAYLGALLARQRIDVQQESIRLLEAQSELARNRYDAGVGPKFDVLQANVALANAHPELLRARNEYRIRIERLRRVIGLPYPKDADPGEFVLEGNWPSEPRIPLYSDALTEALARRPDLFEVEYRRRARENDLTLAHRGLHPRVEAFAGYGIQNDRFSAQTDTLSGWVTGLRASWSVWDGRANSGRVAQRRSQLMQLDLQRRDLILQVEEQVRDNLIHCELALEILRTSSLVIEQADEAVRLARNRFEVGALKQLDVLQAQLALTRARLEQANAYHDLHVAHARLQHSLGGLK